MKIIFIMALLFVIGATLASAESIYELERTGEKATFNGHTYECFLRGYGGSANPRAHCLWLSWIDPVARLKYVANSLR